MGTPVFLSLKIKLNIDLAVPVATFVVAVLCGTDNRRWDVFLNMLLVSIGVVISSYGEIHLKMIRTVTGIVAEALRLVLTQVLLQKRGLALNPITSLYYIAPCSFVFLFVSWYFLEKPGMDISQMQFNFWIFFSNAICALMLNFSIFLVIGRTGAVTVRVAGVLKDWILITLSTVVLPESTVTGLNIMGYAIALFGVMLYNYLKLREARTLSQISEALSNRINKLEKKSSHVHHRSDDSSSREKGNGTSTSNFGVEEVAPQIPSSSGRLSHIGMTLQSGRSD